MQKPDASICAFGANVLLKHLTALNQEIEGVSQAEDIEYIHRMRVASRRLRTALSVFEKCYPPVKISLWQKEIRKVTRALSEVRDTDVQIDRLSQVLNRTREANLRSGIRRLMLRLKQKRDRQQAGVTRAMDELVKNRVLKEMDKKITASLLKNNAGSVYSRDLYQLSADLVQQGLDHLLEYDPITTQPEEVEKLHEMRIAAKHLRYTLEIFLPLYPGEIKPVVQAIRKVQEQLGDIHDLDVWIQFLPIFMKEEREFTRAYFGHERPFYFLLPGLNYFLEDCQQNRIASFQKFSSDWQAWKADCVWDSLQATLRLPLSHSDQVYPPLDFLSTAGQDAETGSL
ncbi:MAG: CHAD domain-containing protein [Chloroflexi bacterium]|nr:CHAD domain-containing protein [Anaerolineaceae bacterium]NMB88187.1 CHAD domain-containing protein [Chloroflexota bacterium]